MRSSNRARLFPITLTLAGLITLPPAAAATTPPGASPLTIVGGGAEAGHPAVGALIGDDGAFCTGTLVSPDTVLTAAHCIAGGSIDGIQFFRGPDVSGPGEISEVASLHQNPNFSWDEDGGDIGLLRLTDPVQVAPVLYLAEPLGDDAVGRQALFVGYGITAFDRDDAGIKRSVEIEITELHEDWFGYSTQGRSTCSGDSGGPAFLEIDGALTLIGVTSWGDDFCQEFGANSRTDAEAAFIQSVIDGEHEGAERIEGGEQGEGGVDDGGEGFDEEWDQEEWEREMGDADPCEVLEWYDDDICDEMCQRPDPDCGGEAPAPDVEPEVAPEVEPDVEPEIEPEIEPDEADEGEDDLGAFAAGDIDERGRPALVESDPRGRRGASGCSTSRSTSLLGALLRR